MPVNDTLSDLPPNSEPDPGPEPSTYLPRTLLGSDEKGQRLRYGEDELQSGPGARVLLGEPGLGKSALMNELGRRLAVTPVNAVRFMLAKSPVKLVEPGKPLLIDGLDEAMARRDGDAVDQVIAQLEEAGSPPFILSCRAREWQSRATTSLKQLYGAEPKVLTLEPFSRIEADGYLRARYPGVDAERVLRHLENHVLEDLYRNPLTLGLMGRVAETDKELPASRAALFERVCELLWPEHDEDRQDSALAQLTQEDALSAAGAICASLLFAGSEAVSIVGAAQVMAGDVRIADIQSLPGAAAAKTIFSSKLFQEAGIGRARPVHRVIAEFLSARWLAGIATSPRVQRRLLAQLQGGGEVPASLRGMHAWLAYHSPDLAHRVICADPYGVLRYGETAALSAVQVQSLFDALEALAGEDPYFRANDWDSRTASGLIIPALASRIDAMIRSATSNSHLRMLLIEGLKGSSLAASFADTMETVIAGIDRYYGERIDAVAALLPFRDRAWWRDRAESVAFDGSTEGPRVARYVIDQIEGDVSDEVLVRTIFAELELIYVPASRKRRGRNNTIRTFGKLLAWPATTRLPALTQTVVDYSAFTVRSDRIGSSDVAKMISTLLARAIKEGAVGPSDAPMIWDWLDALKRNSPMTTEADRKLIDAFRLAPELRHALQLHGIAAARGQMRLYGASNELARRRVGLGTYPGDVVWFLEQMADGNLADQTLRDDWKDLMAMSHSAEGYAPGAYEAGAKFMKGDQQLAAYLKRLENPKKSGWEKREERETAKRARKQRVTFEKIRRQVAKPIGDLQAGVFANTYEPALTYVGLHHEFTDDTPSIERLKTLLGPALAADALLGFEAVLHRADLPTAAEFADGIANGTRNNYCFALMAGLRERVRTGKSLGGISTDVLTSGLMLTYRHDGWSRDTQETNALRTALEDALFTSDGAREQFARTYFEPSLDARLNYVNELHLLSQDADWLAVGRTLAADWLQARADLPADIEVSLISCLTPKAGLASLASIAAGRDAGVFPTYDRLLTWLAVDVVARFETVRVKLAGIGDERPHFLWYLRDLLRRDHSSSPLPISVEQAVWIVSEFRRAWPQVSLGDDDEDQTGYSASDFLRGVINRLANDTGEEAGQALAVLIVEPADSYTETLKHLAAEQRQKRAEENFSPLDTGDLARLLADGPPGNSEDLKALVLEELRIADKKLRGEDIDQARDFWGDDGVPYDENRCRDRLAAIIGPELARYGVQRITEADMPLNKRADLAFSREQLQMPMEVKGQWHDEVWHAATGQLDAKYLIEWRSEQRGIYCVFWFGDLPSASGRRLKKRPNGKAPKTADEMRDMLIEDIPEPRRAHIDVVVLDVTAGKPKTKKPKPTV